MQKPPVESSGASGEPFPKTPVEAIAGDLRRSKRPRGRAGKATPVPDLAKVLWTGEAGAEDRREGERNTNGAVVIGESSAPARGGGEGAWEWTAGWGCVCGVRTWSWAFALPLSTATRLLPYLDRAINLMGLALSTAR